ncbi:SLAM family member 5-like, partial [Sinocyclocheilus grahami]|uniref:SLAM family member 5-like n=1 Tax=Sinocyclocheilus grahami TaxID=75366 RepID=UPI0007AD5029
MKMFHSIWFCLCLCRLAGVFAGPDAVKSVSVMEGDSVSLQTNTKLQTENLITWTFGLSENHIAETYEEDGFFYTYDDGPDGRFRDRMKVDNQTGSLTITDIRTTDSGLYQVTINGAKLQKTYRFNVTVSARLPVPSECDGEIESVFADADAVTSVSVMEGGSVTLESGVTEIQTHDVIMWTFGRPEARIAQINKQAGIFSTYDGPDGRFRDRLKLDHQTGSLTITNTRNTHSGLYQVIDGMTLTTHRFNVTVYARLPCPVISRDCSSSSSSSSSCSLVCSVVNVDHVTLSWYKGNSLLSSISVSDLSISLSLPLEVEYQDKNSYSCVLNNPISN